MNLQTGHVLQQRYRIVSALGQGGMGAVYRAWDTRLKMPVALKEMVPQPGLDDETLAQLREQFEQEAVTMARLKHTHLVGVTDFFEESGNAYLVMEFVDGESLARRIEREGTLSEERVLTWARQLLRALAYCHEQGIIHRDISPQNVIIRPDGQAVLVDFGLVKLWDPRDPRTRTAMRGIGKPEYAPPEQYDAGSGHTDARSDLYSLGATLYHALTGKAPPTATQRIVDSTALAPLGQLKPGIDADLEAAIMRALELQPGARFSTAEEMARALDGEARAPVQPEAPPQREKTKVLPSSRSQPPEPQSLIAQARALAAEGDDEAALATVERLLQTEPDDCEALDLRASIWTRRGDAALARDDLDTALAAYREAEDEERVAEVEALQRQRAIQRMEAQAAAHESTEHWAEATAIYQRLAVQYPEEKDEAGWDAALERCREEEELAQLFEEGREALRREAWEEARDPLAELVSRRVRYERDGLRATQLLDRAAARGSAEPPIWQRVPWWAWAAGGLILAALVTAILASPTQLYGSLHFVSDRTGKREIYRLTRTADLVQVTHTPGDAESWAPLSTAGRSLHFVSDRSGKREIYRITPAAEVVRVTHTPGDAESWAPAIGPGGNLIFVSDRDGKREVYRLTRDAEIVRITHTPARGESWLSLP